MPIRETETEALRFQLTPEEVARYKKINAAADADDDNADPWGYVESLCQSCGLKYPAAASESLDGDILIVCELVYDYTNPITGEKQAVSADGAMAETDAAPAPVESKGKGNAAGYEAIRQQMARRCGKCDGKVNAYGQCWVCDAGRIGKEFVNE